jgi:DNA topoisomerase-1
MPPVSDISSTTLTELTPEESAEYANLLYVETTDSGITRQQDGKDFIYFWPNQQQVKNEETLERIESLTIPPAYKDVWICTEPDGHLQATGEADNGKTQYIYHPRWRQYRDNIKFNEMILFGQLLPSIREHIEKVIRGASDLSKEYIVAVVIRMLDKTHIRIGNEEYSKENDSYGATTLRKRHVDIDNNGNSVTLEFTGKSGKAWKLDIDDPLLVDAINECTDEPGYQLFKYYDAEGEKHYISSDDVNHYLKELTEHDITAKFFRTWAGTVKAVEELEKFKNAPPKDCDEAQKHITEAVKLVAKELKNTPSVCRKCYIHPAIVESYLNNTFTLEIESDVSKYFTKSEAAALSLLKHHTFSAKK